MHLTIEKGIEIDADGGTVSIENSPDCRDPNSETFLRMGEYDTTTQFPVWCHPAMIRYMEITGSKVYNIYMCGADHRTPPVRQGF